MIGGVAYIAPPNHHFLIGGGLSVRLTDTAKVHYVRPSADELFRSAAESGRHSIGVVLTGTGSDGARGATAIRLAGGLVIAQDEASSAFFGMPQAAIEAGGVDRILPLEAIGPALNALARTNGHE
jgi:two-component system chemotaxis response regulator CheB